MKKIELILGSMHLNSKELRTQAFASSLFYQYAEQYSEPSEISTFNSKLKKETENLNTLLKEFSSTSLTSVDDIIKWAFKFDEIKTHFFESEEFIKACHNVGKNIAIKLTESLENHHINNYSETKIDMINMLSTVDDYYK